MQLLNSLPTQFANIPESLQTSLLDIIHKVEIESPYCIKHPDYQSLELPESAIARFQQLPSELQSKYLSQQLRSFLYGIYYNGSLKRDLAPDAEANLALNQNLENNTLLGVDIAFYSRLHESNRGEGYLSYNWQVVKEEIDGALAVRRDGLTLHIEPDVLRQAAARLRYPQSLDKAATVGDLVAIKLPKNLVQNGFYVAVGNVANTSNRQNLVRAYFNLTPDGAVAVMDCLTAQLNSIPIAFTFKALYNPSDYGRYDSAVLYFEKKDYADVQPVLERVYAECDQYFQEQVPLFTKCIAPGLAIAEEPNQKFSEQESFGLNRCQIVANGLLEAWHQGNDTPEARITSILQQFSLRKVELQRPYLNANSKDIYTFLSL
ncbi:hypothetical protein IQ259_14475 [Fortiea sp. LEGE XX443]|uniref:T3SS effector HopA1 family protein n=1 Tax=Fortiea sp. LEGE XX443 TaxID=1828611 RepID=UPI001881405E|nr:T3SS effector HopA1 family protein [Fortiea sp. LEGE XX443]MBE9006228.1 hypothetical protein [Fortiea sp. LEGE XX443]